MKPRLKRLRRVLLIYGAGVLTGIALVLCLVFCHGDSLGARVIAVGVRVANAGAVPYWQVRIAPDEGPIPPALPMPKLTATKIRR
jgi:hypothetical protein